jgi:hypothetical protein
MKAAWKVVSSILPVSKSHPSSKIAESLQAIEQRSSPAFLPFLVFGGTTRYTFGLKMLKDVERRWKSTSLPPEFPVISEKLIPITRDGLRSSQFCWAIHSPKEKLPHPSTWCGWLKAGTCKDEPTMVGPSTGKLNWWICQIWAFQGVTHVVVIYRRSKNMVLQVIQWPCSNI